MTYLFQKFLTLVSLLLKYRWWILLVFISSMLISLAVGKIYQYWDNDKNRGAIAIENDFLGENHSTPVYLEQGWTESESLWFYNTTQGSALLPYDFFLTLEQANDKVLFRSSDNIDQYRYLLQKPTFFNPDGLPVGFTKETYKNKDYMGYTCAACHTAQINYKGQAIRIDGGPAMADLVSFLHDLEEALQATLDDENKKRRFVDSVIRLNNDFDSEPGVIKSLQYWLKKTRLYNTVNHSHVDYGYARLDAFGRIYNRVLQHTISKPQLKNAMQVTVSPAGERILSDQQIDKVLENIDETIIVDKQFSLILDRLRSDDPGYPGLRKEALLLIRDQIFNEPNAPVSYPFLWDVGQSDYVQWNGLAKNSGIGPLGRNTGQAIGVFGLLDWSAKKKDGFSLSAFVTRQREKTHQINFKSSIDIINLRRLEAQLKHLKSPVWPESILGEIDREKAARGQVIYSQYCQSCHEVIDRNDEDRFVIGKMMRLDYIGTDVAMASNSVNYKGKSGNFKHTLQEVPGMGDLLIEEDAPVVQILTSATRGVIATPDHDKWFLRRWLDRLYILALTFFSNEMPATMKSGNYQPGTTSSPYNALLSYKARSLNGVWATAPYLHNGSVPSLYDLLLPQEQRPASFIVGSREFDPVKVGFRSEGYDGFTLSTYQVGDKNTGHEYAAGRTPQLDGTLLPALTEAQRWDLIEYIKTL